MGKSLISSLSWNWPSLVYLEPTDGFVAWEEERERKMVVVMILEENKFVLDSCRPHRLLFPFLGSDVFGC